MVLGENTGDVGTLCKSSRINKFSRKKPVRWSNPAGPTDNELHALRYGLNFEDITEWESDHDTTVLGWGYDKPRGIGSGHTEWFRVLDFDGYNHNAIPPIPNTRQRYSGNASPDGGTFLFDLEAILATGSNVELPISLFPSVFPLQYYLGLCFSSDTRPDEVWWTSVPVTLEMLLSGQQLSNSAWYIPYEGAPYWEDGDTVIACYCLAPRSLITDETDMSPKSTDPTGVIPIVPMAGYGSWNLAISAFTVNDVMGMNLYNYHSSWPISGQWEGSAGAYSVLGVRAYLSLHESDNIPEGGSVELVFRAVVNGQNFGNDKTVTATYYTQITEILIEGGLYIDEYDMRENDNDIIVEFYVWRANKPSVKKKFLYARQNVSRMVIEEVITY